MPPVRSIPVSQKPLKTERTHEENQERAYIAASRRSDRSIEARLESAKRASEVHKKRTGRALRVTQEDVENEEMYEEEDGDLQMNFRNLAAQWYSNSPEFNRKLHAYLAAQSMGNNMPNGFGGNQYGNQAPSQYSGNPFLAQLVQQRLPQNQGQSQQQQQQFQPPQSPGQTGHINFPNNSYRQSPYPMPGHIQRAGSTSDQSFMQQSASEAIAALARRNSTPTHAGQPMSSGVYTGSPLAEPPVPQSEIPEVKAEPASQPTTPLVQSPLETTARPNMPSRQSSHSHSLSMPASQAFNGQQYYTGQVPDTQAMLTPGGGMRQTPFYSYNPNLSRSNRGQNSGMEQTLSPDSLTLPATSTANDDYVTSATSESFPLDGLTSGGFDYSWQFGDGLPSPGSADGNAFSADEWTHFVNADVLDDTSA